MNYETTESLHLLYNIYYVINHDDSVYIITPYKIYLYGYIYTILNINNV